MQDKNANCGNDVNAGMSPLQSQAASDEPIIDLPTIAAIAVHNSPLWAGDVIARIPEEAGPASAAAVTAATVASGRVPASPPSADAGTAPQQAMTLRECPLHIAMRHLAEAAVAQHVLYLEGEVRARPGLINTVSRWERMHTLIRECVCPATREFAVSASALTEIVETILGGLFTPGQQQLRQQFRQALEACAACTSTAECPLGASSDDEMAAIGSRLV